MYVYIIEIHKAVVLNLRDVAVQPSPPMEDSGVNSQTHSEYIRSYWKPDTQAHFGSLADP